MLVVYIPVTVRVTNLCLGQTADFSGQTSDFSGLHCKTIHMHKKRVKEGSILTVGLSVV